MIHYIYSSAPTFEDLSQEEQLCIAESLVPGETYDVIINPPIYSENPHHSGGGTSFIIQRGSTITVEVTEPEVESLPTYDDSNYDLNPPPNYESNP
ncbi:6503_t:CDS:2 [Funneliformis geosporum]|uniref:6503_t:CDS:1 n=1 Tax=Funneliformis geosporum TaxID=1117311 RepID=A0A9W4WSF1_9GLOM|nr:6503_t:CDS:2 [Funneliformis geosporum]